MIDTVFTVDGCVAIIVIAGLTNTLSAPFVMMTVAPDNLRAFANGHRLFETIGLLVRFNLRQDQTVGIRTTRCRVNAVFEVCSGLCYRRVDTCLVIDPVVRCTVERSVVNLHQRKVLADRDLVRRVATMVDINDRIVIEGLSVNRDLVAGADRVAHTDCHLLANEQRQLITRLVAVRLRLNPTMLASGSERVVEPFVRLAWTDRVGMTDRICLDKTQVQDSYGVTTVHIRRMEFIVARLSVLLAVELNGVAFSNRTVDNLRTRIDDVKCQNRHCLAPIFRISVTVNTGLRIGLTAEYVTVAAAERDVQDRIGVIDNRQMQRVIYCIAIQCRVADRVVARRVIDITMPGVFLALADTCGLFFYQRALACNHRDEAVATALCQVMELVRSGCNQQAVAVTDREGTEIHALCFAVCWQDGQSQVVNTIVAVNRLRDIIDVVVCSDITVAQILTMPRHRLAVAFTCYLFVMVACRVECQI